MRTTGGLCILEVSPEEDKRRKVSFLLGCAVEGGMVGLLVMAGVWFPYQIAHRTSRFTLISLPSPIGLITPPPSPAAISFHQSLQQRSARPVEVRQDVVRRVRPADPPEPLAAPALPIEVLKIQNTELQAKLPPAPVVTKPPEPIVGTFIAPAVQPARGAAPVSTGLFGQAARTAGKEKVPLEAVQTGGFGSPRGVPGEAKGGSPGNVPKLGSFEMPEGPGKGNGLGGREGRPGVVANAAFDLPPGTRKGSGIGGVQDSPQTVAGAGFGQIGAGSQVSHGHAGAVPAPVKTGVLRAANEPPPTPAKPARTAQPDQETHPVEILFKPAPEYTEEARRLRVQGEVVLSVVFQANGTLKVLGVTKSLGYGLDQMAEQAASRIRFKPAQEAGKPTDFPATLRIEFRLA